MKHTEITMQASQSTVDPSEVAKFEAMAAEWWDPKGKFKPLHLMNPCRLDYITSQIAAEFNRDLSAARPFEGLRLLDIGCGGGLLSEPMARLGATVIGADAAAGNIPVAQVHAQQSGLDIDYRNITAEALAEAGEQFDIVLNMEVVEHVADPLAYLTACRQLLKPGGLHLCSTINRNPKSFAAAIVGAEYIMRWLPKGTHEWHKFITFVIDTSCNYQQNNSFLLGSIFMSKFKFFNISILLFVKEMATLTDNMSQKEP